MGENFSTVFVVGRLLKIRGVWMAPLMLFDFINLISALETFPPAFVVGRLFKQGGVDGPFDAV
ncbi:hypothetical protein A6B38_05900 [Bartonella bacilliformis]|nr:hypothetical protein AL467_01195 [Bartonella bacilliformis]EKS45863.1 hypothetical protein BbINS_01081 [Bartonella bacilliformis INS]KZN21332.1 hypothetical protein A6B38_05900 [Bartonella bacilliformis]